MPVRVLDDRLYKEASTPEVYVLHDGRKIHIPSEESLLSLGYSRAEVVLVPDGALDAFPTYRIESASRTPGSVVFPPITGAHYSKRIATSQRIKVRTIGADDPQLVEIRGWIVKGDRGEQLPSTGIGNVEGPGFDFGFRLIPDYRWLESQGIDTNSLIMVGNFTIATDEDGGVTAGSGVAGSGTANDKIVRVTPTIKCEVNSWMFQGQRPPALSSPPNDWIRFAPPGGIWPFLPNTPDGQYVSVHGSLVTDNPHSGPWSYIWDVPGKTPREIDKWCPGWPWAYPGEGRDHLARWTEIHPVDDIRAQVDPGRHETVYGLLLTSNVRDCNSMQVTLTPRTPRPPNTVAAYKELIGSESLDPNNDSSRHYIRVTKTPDSITVTAHTCGDSLGSHGRIKALYRLWWEPALVTPPSPRVLNVSVSPTRIRLNVSVWVTVNAKDAVTGVAVAGKVKIDNRIVGDTNQRFRFTFKARTVIVRGRQKFVYPKGAVVAAGFRSVALDFDFIKLDPDLEGGLIR